MNRIFRISSIIVFLLAINISTYGQRISVVKPVHIVWDSGEEKISLKQAKTVGTSLSDSLMLEIFFTKEEIQKINKEKISFEFRWFFFMVTQKRLMDAYIVNLNSKDIINNESYKISSTRKNLRKGWWEVQVICTVDNGLLSIGKLSSFQIFLK